VHAAAANLARPSPSIRYLLDEPFASSMRRRAKATSRIDPYLARTRKTMVFSLMTSGKPCFFPIVSWFHADPRVREIVTSRFLGRALSNETQSLFRLHEQLNLIESPN